MLIENEEGLEEIPHACNRRLCVSETAFAGLVNGMQLEGGRGKAEEKQE